MMYTSTLAALALMSVTSAQSTVSLFLPGFDQQALEASIIGSQSAMTTYAVKCAANATATASADDSNECGIASALTVTQGASCMQPPPKFAVHFLYGADDGLGQQETVDLACQITSSKTAACTGSAIGAIGSSSISSVAATTFTDAAQYYMAVTITAGAGGSATNTAASTGASSKSSSKASSGSGAGASASSSTSKGAMPMITGNAWVAGGAACAIAMAAM